MDEAPARIKDEGGVEQRVDDGAQGKPTPPGARGPPDEEAGNPPRRSG